MAGMKAGKNVKIKRESVLFGQDDIRKTGVVFFSFSVFLHGMFFIGMLFFQDFLPKPKAMPPVVQLDLVSFSPDLSLDDDPAKLEVDSKNDGIPIKQTHTKPKKRKLKSIKPDISLKTKPKNLKELMAKTKKKKAPPKVEKEKKPLPKPEPAPEPKPQIDTEAVLADAREKLEKKIDQENQAQIDQALNRLKEKIKEQGKINADEKQGAYQGVGKKGYKPIDLYHLFLGTTIEQNWIYNDVMARIDQNLEVRVLIKILKSGEIRDITYETKSGNRYLDESAKKAIKRSNPLPQLPKGMHSYDVVLVFTPKGLK